MILRNNVKHARKIVNKIESYNLCVIFKCVFLKGGINGNKWLEDFFNALWASGRWAEG